ncbi:hypothetical protein ACFQ2B_15305 [Streptomyces stramineus]
MATRKMTSRSLLRSLWRRTRSEADEDTEAGRAIVMPVQHVAAPCGR